ASYPTPRIEENSHKFRPLGLGYANLGALLMSRGLAYDSDEGRNYAAALTAIMHGEAYKQSAAIARDHGGPFWAYDENREPFLRVINKHRDAAYKIPSDQAVPYDMIEAARSVYDEALDLGERYGYRNAQVTVLAPTGTIAFTCAFKPANGERSIHYMGHVRMMGAVQPFLSGAISKTVNMPEAATPEEIEKVYLEGWKLGLKAIAVYRDNSKRSQPLSTGK